MVVPLTERRKGDNPMNETAERVEKAGDINEAYRLVYIYGKENPKDIDGLIALNKLLISKTGDRANNANDRNTFMRPIVRLHAAIRIKICWGQVILMMPKTMKWRQIII